jgi:hypothetical protein
MIESFWKKYWFELLTSIGFFVGAIVLLCFGNYLSALVYFVSSFCWLLTALIGYNNMRIEALAKRIADLEAELDKDKK